MSHYQVEYSYAVREGGLIDSIEVEDVKDLLPAVEKYVLSMPEETVDFPTDIAIEAYHKIDG